MPIRFVPATQIADFTAEMQAAKIDYQLCLYGGVGHGFTDRDVPEMPGFALTLAPISARGSHF